jgi:hypothetical protein
VSTVEVKGLAEVQQRLAAAGAPGPLKATLRGDADSIAEEARRGAPGELEAAVEIVDQNRGSRLAYAIGTRHPAGRLLEFGSLHRAATPWLWPVFRARTRGINHKLRKLVVSAFKNRRALV